MPGVKSKGQKEKLAGSRGGNGVEVIAAAHVQARSGRREPVIVGFVLENVKVNPAITNTTKPSICFVAEFLFKQLTLPVRMFISKSLMQSQDIEFPATTEVLHTFCCHHKRTPSSPLCDGEKGSKKINYDYLL